MTIQKLQQLEFAPHANIGAARRWTACSNFYSDQDARAVWEREGKFAEQFGFSGCCKGLAHSESPYDYRIKYC